MGKHVTVTIADMKYRVSVIKDETRLQKIIMLASELTKCGPKAREKKIDLLRELIYDDGSLRTEVKNAIDAIDSDVPSVQEVSNLLRRWMTEEGRSSMYFRGSSELSEKLLPISKAILSSMSGVIGSNINPHAALACGVVLYGLVRKRGLRFKVERVIERHANE